MEDRELEPAEARIPYATLIFSVASVWIYNDTYTTYIYNIYMYIYTLFSTIKQPDPSLLQASCKNEANRPWLTGIHDHTCDCD